jgi:hypothetical protein
MERSFPLYLFGKIKIPCLKGSTTVLRDQVGETGWWGGGHRSPAGVTLLVNASLFLIPTKHDTYTTDLLNFIQIFNFGIIYR